MVHAHAMFSNAPLYHYIWTTDLILSLCFSLILALSSTESPQAMLIRR